MTRLGFPIEERDSLEQPISHAGVAIVDRVMAI